MISEQTISKLVTEKILGTSVFLVQVKIKPVNKIEIYVDEPSHISIETCIAISKFIESKLNRDEEDFELTVSSPGIDAPFVVLPQYEKYVGKQVSVLQTDGLKFIGTLHAVSPEAIELETKITERKQLGKGKQTRIEHRSISFNQIKETKLILPF